ncbi:MAG: hypothetical protein EBV03_08175 [Proteobacteria bacterium]|nr:hypothetical protein [Pseudomonadota bacterium]
MSKTQLSRRDFMRAGTGTFVAAVAGSGCSSDNKNKPGNPEEPKTLDPAQIAEYYQAKANPDSATNLYNLLGRYSFTDQNGKAVNVGALKTSLKNRFTTLTFGFGECKDYCPMINNRLGLLGDANPQLSSIVVCVNPDADGATQASRDAMLAKLRSEGMKQDIVLLFPSSTKAATDMAMDTGAIVNPRQPFNHSTQVILHAPGGTELARKRGDESAKSFPAEWGPVMSGRGIRQ